MVDWHKLLRFYLYLLKLYNIIGAQKPCNKHIPVYTAGKFFFYYYETSNLVINLVKQSIDYMRNDKIRNAEKGRADVMHK